MSEPAIKQLKDKSFSSLTPTPKVTVFKNLLQNKIYNKAKK